MKLKEKYFPRGTFRSNVMVLASGTLMAQAIPVILSPILTRLYSPTEFGKFALYMAAVSIMIMVVTCRYELSILLPERVDERINSLALAVSISFIMSFLALLALLIYRQYLIVYIHSTLPEWLYIIPFVSLSLGIYQSLNYWLISAKMFNRLSINKIILYGSMTIIQIAMGFLKFGYWGLIYGHIFGQVLVTILLVYYVFRKGGNEFGLIKPRLMIMQAKRYVSFPKFSLPADLINILSNQMPYLLLNNYFGTRTVGLFSLPQRVLGAPISFLASSILDVFKERATKEYQQHGNCLRIYSQTFKYLLLLSSVVFGILFVASPEAIPFIFGEQWRTAGEYAQILCLLFFFRFVASPLSFVIFITEKQKYDLIWQIFLLAFMFISIMAGVYLKSAKMSILFFSISYSGMYVTYIFLTYTLAKGTRK